MTRALKTPCLGRLVMLAVLGSLLTGCASMGFDNPDIRFGPRIGFRPDEPLITPRADPCDEYKTFAAYTLNLKEAYRTRTTQNRTWIYVAGLTGLGVAAA